MDYANPKDKYDYDQMCSVSVVTTTIRCAAFHW